ncbi:MAG: sugar transferase [Planctomycetota bacterium]|jgi:lipopolysaccharide/colanic/teichoic acid biosynthesis glycosyltransferase
MKRIFDLIIVIPAALILLLVFIFIWLIIRLTSNGAAIFRQERAGINGKPFIFYKFRTMKLDADPFGSSPKTSDDPRITKVGKFLREYSLDELPQLFNILKGDMSLVGPRPLYISQMAEWNDRQKKRLEVKPGLTGLAQVSGRGELTIEEKLELDVVYVETHGFFIDLKIIAATIFHVFGRKNIYEKRYSEKEATRGEKNSEV